MPAAVPISIGVAGALGLYGAKKQADAAKSAAQMQTDAGNRALDLQRQMYQQDRADQAPYRQIGYGALNTLGSMMGPSFNAGGGGFQPSMGGQPTQPMGNPPMGNGFTFGGPPRSVGSGSTPMAAQTGSGEMVLMQAPNGTQRRVPPQAVPHFEARGATVVS